MVRVSPETVNNDNLNNTDGVFNIIASPSHQQQSNEVIAKVSKKESTNDKVKVIVSNFKFGLMKNWLSGSQFQVGFNTMVLAVFMKTIANKNNFRWTGSKYELFMSLTQSLFPLGLALSCFTYRYHSKMSLRKLYAFYHALTIISVIISIIPNEIC